MRRTVARERTRDSSSKRVRLKRLKPEFFSQPTTVAVTHPSFQLLPCVARQHSQWFPHGNPLVPLPRPPARSPAARNLEIREPVDHIADPENGDPVHVSHAVIHG